MLQHLHIYRDNGHKVTDRDCPWLVTTEYDDPPCLNAINKNINRYFVKESILFTFIKRKHSFYFLKLFPISKLKITTK